VGFNHDTGLTKCSLEQEREYMVPT